MSTVANIKTVDWKRGLLTGFDKKGRPVVKRGLANTLHVLSLHPAWGGVLAYNELLECVVKRSTPPVRKQDAIDGDGTGEWTEADSVRAAAWFATEIGFEPTTGMVEQAIGAVAERARIHPVRDYLRSLAWDGAPRAERFLTVYFGSPDSDYTRAIGARWLLSAVARVMIPGCQADHLLVLEGAQGIRKSTALEALFSKPWFADTGIHIGDKDSYQSLRGKWGYELGEMVSVKGREVERVKNFLTARVDNYRPSYGRRNRDFPRQVVFAGSTNDEQYLADRTGNRRFWPVPTPRIDIDAIRRDRDQLWGETFVRYEKGELWHVDTVELRTLCEQEQKEREPTDAWVEIVAKWLAAPSVPDGKDARHYLDKSKGITTAEVLLGALSFKPSDIRRGEETRVGHVLRELGWVVGSQKTVEGDDGEKKRVRVYMPKPALPAQPNPQTGCVDDLAGNPAQNAHAQPTQPECTHTQGGPIGTARSGGCIQDVQLCGDDVEREAIQGEGDTE